MKERVIILGAAGRDFHDFLTWFKRRPRYEVVAFTAEQIPGIAGRRFPRELAGKRRARLDVRLEEREGRIRLEAG